MNIKTKMAEAKPFIVGGVVGAVAVAIVGFASGFVVQTSTMEENVREARISTLAQVCQRQASTFWADQGRTTSDLRGWRNEERKQLATQFVPLDADGSPIRDAVIDACDRMLRNA